MKHYIQFDTKDDSWALYRLWENKRTKITNLSEEDMDTFYLETTLYKRNKEIGKKILETLIGQEETTLLYITEYFKQTDIGKKLMQEAIERIKYLKHLIINSQGEPEDDRDITTDERGSVHEGSREEEETRGPVDGVHT